MPFNYPFKLQSVFIPVFARAKQEWMAKPTTKATFDSEESRWTTMTHDTKHTLQHLACELAQWWQLCPIQHSLETGNAGTCLMAPLSAKLFRMSRG